MKLNKARAAIKILSAAGVLLAILIRNETLSSVLVLLCALGAAGILFHHLPELSGVSPDNPKAKTIRQVTLFNITLITGAAALAYLIKSGDIRLSERQYSYLLPVIISAVILFFGNIAPKLPFNRYTGLRLPWTVTDEETWILAHRLLGYLSFPCGVLSLAGISSLSASVNIPMLMLMVWIIVPSLLSGLFYWRKWNPRN